ncbi:pantoate--beta-alanine ligase [Halobacillus naozhouensis]|uniref:Pantothenate synthetase n=1 Tax=Halobacillus naozhouensis TaxID=554880 RepID=A0ABY8ISZ1_9BACI|nr:pantoate--beta-alanine ligase [Halobacillus naozhouensis]WFT73078.1 pantoate--beta-alanine ligase [Halobacillus naozhouensis]
MKITANIKEMQQIITEWSAQGKKIGFVPTMGFLHDGHQALLKKARLENDLVVLSIFVNPLQFGANEDLDSYPRDQEHDKKIAEKHGIDVIFLPDEQTMYPGPLSINLSVVRRTDVLCGRSRPGHFDGVATVLTKLFNITRPSKVYFGLKDAQQIAVVDALIEDFNFPIELIAVPTVREEDGLAKSSRNVNLLEQERSEAPYIQQALQHGREYVGNGENNSKEVIEKVRQFLERKTHGKIDYIELLSYPDLQRVETINQQVILAAAVQFQNARLIDNVIFNEYGIKTLG